MFFGQARVFVENDADAAIAIHKELEHMTQQVPRATAIRELRKDLFNAADDCLDRGDFGRLEMVRLLLVALDNESPATTDNLLPSPETTTPMNTIIWTKLDHMVKVGTMLTLDELDELVTMIQKELDKQLFEGEEVVVTGALSTGVDIFVKVDGNLPNLAEVVGTCDWVVPWVATKWFAERNESTSSQEVGSVDE